MKNSNPPIRTKYQFAPGGNMIPIVTLPSGSTRKDVLTHGLSKSKTTLGAYRMGEADGNAAPSAIYPGEIFPPNPRMDRQYTDVMFENVGNRTFQPTSTNDRALHALLSRLGEQKFKAEAQAPYEDYFATQRLARDVERASKLTSLEDLGHSREILRNLVDIRRKQAEDDYLRKMLDSGMSSEDAQDEIENVRRAMALQEVRKIDDRAYQAKLLITRLANSRGLLSKVKEPLTQSGAIDNPTPSQELASLAGRPGEGFGSAPLDTARQFLTPEYYRRFLRRSNLTQGVADEMTAMSQLASEGEQFATIPMLSAREREIGLEQTKEALASRLERVKKVRIMVSLPPILFADNVLQGVYANAGKKPGDSSRFQRDDIQEMSGIKLLLSINQLLALSADKVRMLKAALVGIPLRDITSREQKPLDTIRDTLRQLTRTLNEDKDEIMIPFSNISRAVTSEEVVRAIEMFRGLSPQEVRGLERSAATYSSEYEAVFNDPAQGRSAEEFLRPQATRIPRMATGATAVPIAVEAVEQVDGGAGAENFAAAADEGEPAGAAPVRQLAASATWDAIEALATRLGIPRDQYAARGARGGKVSAIAFVNSRIPG